MKQVKQKNNNTLEYKGYIGSIEFSHEDNCLFGKLIGLQKGSILYEGNTIEELTEDFHEAVDDYLEYCKQANILPEKPYTSSFNVQINPKLHKQA